MVNLRDMINTISTSAHNIYDKVSTSSISVNSIGQSWEGADHDAFREAYAKLNTQIQDLYEQYKSLQSQLSSLQSSIDAAEQDKQNKKMQKKRW